MIRIKKLTPPQIAALRDAFPAMVQAGMLETTASVATFRPTPHDVPTNVVPMVFDRLKKDWTPDRVKRLVDAEIEKQGRMQTLLTIRQKLETRPDLVEVIG